MTRTDILARAFELRRAFSAQQVDRLTPSLGPCDCLLVSILIDLGKPLALAMCDGEVREALEQALTSTMRGNQTLSQPEAGDSRAPLRLLHFDQIDQRELENALYLVHDLPRRLPLINSGRLADRRLIPFAFLSSATWSSSLALLTSPDVEADATDLIERLSDILISDELDPLSLYDELQSLRTTSPSSREGAADLSERCRVLERQLRGLEVSGLIRYQALLADANRRRKLSP